MKHTARPPNFSSTRLFTPEKAIWVSVTMVQPCRMAAMPASTAPAEKTRLSAYSKSAVVWITRLTTGSCSAGNTRSPSSWPMSSMLRASMSAGATRCNSMCFMSLFLPVENPVNAFHIQAGPQAGRQLVVLLLGVRLPVHAGRAGSSPLASSRAFTRAAAASALSKMPWT